MTTNEYLLTFSCADRRGLVHAVSTWLVGHDCNILSSDQHADIDSGRFFMRVKFEGDIALASLRTTFEALNPGGGDDLTWQITDAKIRPRAIILASREDHCLSDLLYRRANGELHIDVALIVSNHRDVYALAASHDIDFMHLPITPATKAGQERRLLDECRDRDVEFLVLARYMQILTPEFCAALPGRIINIHHSFLPGFKGANPYRQAFNHGVKLIGATAHYVTADLDEGPIIEQDVARVDHRMRTRDLVAVGRDVERMVLARAVRHHAERRVLLNGNRTVVFN